MPKFLPTDSSDFPLPATAENDGLLAFGSNMKSDTLLKAYSLGIFPWFNEGELIYWYTPDPRFVLYPDKIKISHSMRNVFNKGVFKFSIDKAFSEVVRNCRTVNRAGNPGSWISDEFEIAYNNLFLKGYAHSAEAWHKNELVGGLYGVLIGKVFFGESMFSTQSNASKFAFINWASVLQKNGVELIDCQVYTPHLEKLGAELISRNQFIDMVRRLTAQ